jgi:tRNA-uridine 2-sulfurtransferase
VDQSGFQEHLAEPIGRGPVPSGAVVGTAGGGPCGDLVRLAIRAAAGRVDAVTFDAEGCGAAVAAASACVQLVEGRSLLEAARVGADDVARELGGLSPGKRHAAVLAADALHRALSNLCRAGAGSLLEPSPIRTLVAMSGGVDSAVAAVLAREAGDEVVAVTLELWSDPATDGTDSCCSPEAVVSARSLAHSMGLPHLTLDLRDQFRQAVVDD